MDDLKQAVKLGMECRRSKREYGAVFKNPMPEGSLMEEAWEAGYRNDLQWWMSVRRRAQSFEVAV